ncbi:hypothetical protein [Lagierella sp.]|uniref:hypothetical protein n=1 Tax=Lagierella sp. TaxID=2849657 RepID=UPI00261DA083|nr:hypothetical protein [Lagierella sp.]
MKSSQSKRLGIGLLLIVVLGLVVFYFSTKDQKNEGFPRISDIVAEQENSRERYLKAMEIVGNIPDFKLKDEEKKLTNLEEKTKQEHKDKNVEVEFRTLKEDIDVPTENKGIVKLTMYSESVVLVNKTDNTTTLLDSGFQYIYGDEPFIGFRNGGFNINDETEEGFRASATGEFIFDKSVGKILGDELKEDPSNSTTLTVARNFKI